MIPVLMVLLFSEDKESEVNGVMLDACTETNHICIKVLVQVSVKAQDVDLLGNCLTRVDSVPVVDLVVLKIDAAPSEQKRFYVKEIDIVR